MTIFVGVIFHAPLSVWLGTLLPEFAQSIKAWKECLLAIAALLVIIEVTRYAWWRRLFSDWVIRLSLIYALIHLLTLAIIPTDLHASLAGLLIDLRFVLFFVVVYSFVSLHPTMRKPLIIGGVSAAVVALLFTLLQVTVLPHDILKYIGYDKVTTIAPYLTVDQNYEYIRINGTFRGPNPLGAYAVIVLAVGTAFLVSRIQTTFKQRGLIAGLLALALVAEWFSYSRSALVAAGVAVGLVVVMNFGRFLNYKWWLGIGGAMVAGLAMVILLWNTSFVQQVLLHNNPEGGSAVSSNDDHVASLDTGWRRMMAQPFGAGVGSTGSASLDSTEPIIIENQYLFIAHEVGWTGLGVFIALMVLILVRLYRARHDWLALGVFSSGIGLSLIGFLLPVWVDDTVSLVWFGLAGIALATCSYQKRGILDKTRKKVDTDERTSQ